MTRDEFRAMAASRLIRLDGATGTELAKRGMPGGVCPEMWILENPDAINDVQTRYLEAGSDIIYVPSFGGNRAKLTEFGLESRTAEINRRLAELIASQHPEALRFGDLAPTGQFIDPGGDLPFDEAVAIFREQIEALIAGGVSGLVIETMFDLQEVRAALLAAREVCDLPVMVTMTFEPGGRTMTGCDAISALLTVQSLGADAFGCNCSTGPLAMKELIAAMKPFARIPLIAKPNAGMPRMEGGKTVFDLAPQDFARETAAIVEAGGSILGGCCGTSPEYIAALSDALRSVRPPEIRPTVAAAVSSARQYRELTPSAPFAVIGERLNPTGKKALQEALREQDMDLVQDLAQEQVDNGAHLLDVNCGMPGIDEAATLRRVISEICLFGGAPLCIDTTDAAAAEAALRLYPGRALFNSISAERYRLEKLLPVAAKYGAMLVLLPLTDQGIPATLEERIAALETILQEAAKYGIGPEDCCVDALAMTAAANPESPDLTLGMIEYAAQRNMNTVCGLSNISYQLPKREIANAAFLGMAIGRGLNMAIVNPSSERIMDTICAGDMLRGKREGMQQYLERFAQVEKAPNRQEKSKLPLEEQVRLALLHGSSDMADCVQTALAAGFTPAQLVNDILIPAITEVGQKFEEKTYFLPQLVRSADAMRQAMEVLNPLLSQEPGGTVAARPKIVLATVRGDIHDIGKNIVGLMLNNNGFDVIDLGKDVAAEKILAAADESGAKIIGLSALMTTTMQEMDGVIQLAREQGRGDLHFIVGGAVLTDDYARSIGAEYAPDAMATVHIAKKLTENDKKA
ncbi:MAG: homocysteine S-methyltransferase family protein [Lentisphaeria bacterium]|nr:homocysteine S-methyltransferase family protein [Lentisphaeria bacterium]